MEKLQIIYKRVSDLVPYENNPRLNDGAVDYVATSISSFGFKVPIVIDSNGVIVCGHTRLKAAKQLGIEEVPCIIADDLSEEQVDAFRLIDNKVSEFSTWDFNMLETELESINDIDMSDFGFYIDGDFGEFNDYVEEKEESSFSEKKEKYTTCPHCGMKFVPILTEE